MLTMHPTAAKAYDVTGLQGYRPMITLRNSRGHMSGSKCSNDFYLDKQAARNAAREAAQAALRTLARDYPGFLARVA